MTERYSHTQIGTLILVLLGLMTLFLIYLMIGQGPHPAALAVVAILVICMALFATLTVSVEDAILTIRFGVGLIRKRFPLSEMESVRIVKNPWYYGWGIHLTPDGWLYNVSGVHAVEIRLRSGRKVRVGTDVPHELEDVLRRSIDSAAI